MPVYKITTEIVIEAPTSDIPNSIADNLDEMVIREIAIKDHLDTTLVSVEPVVEEIQ
jgi:hypothetical protein